VYAQQFIRASVATDGAQGNGPSLGGVISGNGRFVVFSSAATNLVASDTNNSRDVFVRDLVGNTTTRVSVSTDGSEHAGESGVIQFTRDGRPYNGVSITPDGNIVAFSSRAPLVADDTNTTCVTTSPSTNCSDIYVRDRTTNQTTRVSVASDGTQANGDSYDPQVSADGRFVVFTSLATNIAPGATPGVDSVFVHDRVTHATTLLNGPSRPPGNLSAGSYSIRASSDGQVVVYVADTPQNSDPDPLPCPTMVPCGRAYVLDRANGVLTRVPMTVEAAGANILGATVYNVAITPDARFVAIRLNTIVPIPGSPGYDFRSRLLVYDRVAKRLEPYGGGGVSYEVSISDDGRFAAMAGGAGGVSIVLPLVGIDRRINLPLTLPEPVQSLQNIGNLSGDGMRLVFPDYGADVPADTNGTGDVYVLNRDADADGMPDDWEIQFGLSPTSSADAALDPDGDGVTTLQEYLGGTNPKGTFKRYFAEGSANSFFSTRFALFNPGDHAATVMLDFLGSNSQTRSTFMVLVPHEWRAIELNDTSFLQPDNAFSTVIDADRQVIADRTMSWDKSGYGSHAETAIEAPATTWYLAEGSTGGRFDLFYLLQNPGDTAANVAVTYLLPAPAAPVIKTYAVAPRTRQTIWVDQEDPAIESTDVSGKIVSDQPILVERAMYFSTPDQPFAAGHEGAAIQAPSTHWFLAEGATGSFFDLFLLLSNAEPTAADVQVTYLLAAGAPIVKHYTVAAQSRMTINVDFENPRLVDTPVSTIVESMNSVPVIAERAMWWPSPNWYEAHLSAGTTTTGTTWALAEGLATNTPGSETETYILIANTSATPGTADVTLYFGDGTTLTKNVTLPASSRVSIQTSVDFPKAVGKGGYGTIVQSNGVPIVVERAMYTNANGQIWAAGTDALATKLQ
jgi:hypothetical protein